MIEKLLEYQEIDKNLKRIEQDLAQNEDRKKALSAKNYIVEGEELAAKIDRRAEELVNVFKKLNKSYEEYSQNVEEYQGLYDSTEKEEEILYLSKKINQDLNSIKNIEKDLNALKSDIESTNKSFNDFKKRFMDAKVDYAKYKESFDKYKDSKAEEIAKAEKELSDLAKKIDKALMEKYNKKRGDRIFPIIVLLKGNMCSGCNTEVPLSDINKLKGENFIECENCRRLIIKKA